MTAAGRLGPDAPYPGPYASWDRHDLTTWLTLRLANMNRAQSDGVPAWGRLDVSVWAIIFHVATSRRNDAWYPCLTAPYASRPSAFLNLMRVCRAWKVSYLTAARISPQASLLTCITQQVAEPLIFVNMDLEYCQVKLLVGYLYTCDPSIAHPTHRTTCPPLPAPPHGRWNRIATIFRLYSLSCPTYKFCTPRMWFYSHRSFWGSHTIPISHLRSCPSASTQPTRIVCSLRAALPDWRVCDSCRSPSIATRSTGPTMQTVFFSFWKAFG
jgi:hypothetical protein